MRNKKKEELKEFLSLKLEQYVKYILKEYSNAIEDTDLERINKISDYKEHIKIMETGTISCYVNDGKEKKIFFPENISKILKMLKIIPGYGTDKNHETYTKENIVSNNNTFETYLKHMLIKGENEKEFYEENLLHESLHFCGAGGVTPLLEGLTEYRTRELAVKYDLKTTGCGYPKEVQIVEQLQELFGEKFMNMYLFNCGGDKSLNYLREQYGKEALTLLEKVEKSMKKEFMHKYYEKTFDFKGIFAPIKKCKAYRELNYEETYELINEYKEKFAKLESKTESIYEYDILEKDFQKIGKNRKKIVAIQNQKGEITVFSKNTLKVNEDQKKENLNSEKRKKLKKEILKISKQVLKNEELAIKVKSRSK